MLHIRDMVILIITVTTVVCKKRSLRGAETHLNRTQYLIGVCKCSISGDNGNCEDCNQHWARIRVLTRALRAATATERSIIARPCQPLQREGGFRGKKEPPSANLYV